ncbi:MAG: 3-dehydroquinate dehydratase [Chlorobi bacterium]|nr:3-dehydroquinate dehydratase [Chlorobiota bacterium]
MKILILNGPNLNLTGKREKDIYGNLSFEEYLENIKPHFPGFDISYFQSNIEGEMINKLQEANQTQDGVILNAGGYTHTSVALADAVKSTTIPVVEVHISNILAREEYRHISLIAPHCAGSVFGFGLDSYRLALVWFGFLSEG